MNNTAKLSDIITALQNLQGINQKADLKSALETKGIDVSEADGVAELISELNNANLVLNGKRWASGTATILEDTRLIVTGLDFEPVYAMIYMINNNTSGNLRGFFSIGSKNKDIYMSGPNLADFVKGYYTSGGSSAVGIASGAWHGDGFEVATMKNIDVIWLAFE